MTLTQAQLRRAVPNVFKGRIDEFVASFNQWAIPMGIDTPLRAAHYLAQVFHESGCLRYTEELASGAAYDTGAKAQALGNTPEKDGDGQKYKGRGYIQLTGRTNYANFAKSDCCTEDVVAHPELVAKVPLNQIASMWFWQTNGLSAIADQDNGQNTADVCKRITKRVNGGQNGYNERFYYLRRFKKEFAI